MARRARILLISRDFALLWTASAISRLGDVVYTTTLILWIATQLAVGRWAPLAVGGLAVIESVVAIAGGPLAGVFVDRWRKRALLVRMDVVRGVVVATLLAAQLAGRGRADTATLLSLVYVLVVIEESCSLFANPAEMVLMSEIVAPGLRGRAAGLMRSAGSAAVLIGPPLAAPLLFVAGVQWGMALNAASFFVAAVLRRRISVAGEVQRGDEQPAPAFSRELRDGVRYARDNPTLRAILALLAAIGLAAGAVNALMVFFVTVNLHAPPRLYGVMGTANAVGVLAGSFFAIGVAQALRRRQAVWLVTASVGLLLLLLSRMTAFGAGVALGVAFGVTEALASVVITPLLMDSVAPAFLGRALSLINTADGATRTTSVFLFGALASTAFAHLDVPIAGMHFRTYDSIFGICALIVVVASVWARTHLRAPVAVAAEPATQLA